MSNNVTIDAGAGNDSIQNDSSIVSIHGGAGNDTINLSSDSSNVTVQGGTGDDSIVNYGGNVVYRYADGDGNDTITGYSTGDTIQIAAPSYTTAVSGSHKVINVGTGTITLLYAKNKTLNVQLVSSLDLTAIENSESSIALAGTADADTISNSGDNVTINAGAGDDIISLTGGSQNNVIEYSSGDGSDTIYGYDSSTAIRTDSFNYATTGGDDMILSVGDGEITLKDAASSVAKIETDYSTIYAGFYGAAVTLDGNTFTFGDDGGTVEVTEEGFVLNGYVVSAEGDGRFHFGEESICTVNGVEYYFSSPAVIENNTVVEGSVSVTLYNGGEINTPEGTIWASEDLGEVRIEIGDGSVYAIYCDYWNWGASLEFNGRTYQNFDGPMSVTEEGYGQRIYFDLDYNVNLLELDEYSSASYIQVGDYIDLNWIEPYGYESYVFGFSDHYYDSDTVAWLNVEDGMYNLRVYYNDLTIDATGIENLNLNIGYGGAHVNVGSGEYEHVINGSVYKVASDYAQIYATSDYEYPYLESGSVILYEYANYVQLYNDELAESVQFVAGDEIVATAEDNALVEISELNAGDVFNLNDDEFKMTAAGLTRNNEYIWDGEEFTGSISVEELYNGDNWAQIIAVDSDGVVDLTEFNKNNGRAVIVDNALNPSERHGGLFADPGEEEIWNTWFRADVFIKISDDHFRVSSFDEEFEDEFFRSVRNPSYPREISFSTTKGASLINGSATVYDSLKFGDGGKIQVANNADGVEITVVDGEISEFYGLTDGGSFTYSKDSDTITVEMTSEILKVNRNGEVLLYAGESISWSDILSGSAARNDSLIEGTDGADNIVNTGSNNTIIAGAGDDTIYTNGDANLILYAQGDGNDYISGFSANDTIQITGGKYQFAESGTDVILTVGEGKITLAGAAGMELNIDGTPAPVTLTGTAKADTISNDADSAVIDALAGNDVINNSGSGVSINGGAGNDTIYATAGGNIYTYSSGDGKDVIYGFGAGDTLQITKGAVKSTLLSGADFVINVGSGSITLKEITGGTTFALADSEGAVTEVTVPKILQGTAKADTLTNENDGYLVDALAGNDIISLVGGENVTVNAGAGNDTIYAATSGNIYTYSSGDGRDVIFGFGEGDTLQITKGAVKSTLLSGKDFVLNVGSGSITLKDVTGGTEFTLLDENGAGSQIIIPSLRELTTKADDYQNDEEEFEIYALGGNDSIDNFAYSATIYGGADNDNLYNAGETSAILGEAGNDSIENFAQDSTINGGAGNDYIYSEGNDALILGGAGNDTVENFGDYATITAGAGNDTIYNDGANTLYRYGTGDGKDLIVGFTENDTLEITSGTIKSTSSRGTDVVLNVGSGAITGTARSDSLENDYDNFGVSGLGGADKISNSGFSVTIDGGAGSDYIYNSGSDTSILGGSGNDTISNTGENVTITGGKGNDVIDLGDASNALINYASGDGRDVIYGFGEGDTLKITSGSVKSSVQSGDDIVLNIGNGKITLKETAGYDLTIDNNFVTAGGSLSEIVASRYAVTGVEADSDFEIAQSDRIFVTGNTK